MVSLNSPLWGLPPIIIVATNSAILPNDACQLVLTAADAEIRAYLKTGNMTNSEEFFRCASHFFAGILAVLQGKMVWHSGKRPAGWAF